MVTFKRKRARRPGRIVGKFLLLLIIAGGGASFFLFFEGSQPTINLTAIPTYIGTDQILDIEVEDTDSGLRHIEVTAAQGENVKPLYSVTNPRLTYTGQIGPLTDKQSLKFDAKKLGFTDGPITLSVTAHDFSLRGMLQGNSTTATATVTLDTKPPIIKILHNELYISPGGAGIVVYTVSDSDSNHGAVINGYFNGGHPVGNTTQDTYIAYFALPYNAVSLDESHIMATDIAGNTAILPFSTKFKARKQKQDRINISDGFLSKKIPEFEQFYPELPGNLVEKYLYTNQTIRQENNKEIAELCADPDENRFWAGPFNRMSGSNRAGYADHRTYYYNDQPIDNQVHLGMDIASTQHANVTAGNKGKIVFADYLGIYGNMVLIDHGQGVFSLYSHLSQINTAVGSLVSKDDSIGLTGTTGMAGGDHLHFSMLVNGIFVTPLEWWDPHWIDVTITKPLATLNL